MSDTLTYQRMGMAGRGRAHVLYAQTMSYVAATAALFALGAWLGRNLSGGVGIVAYIAAFACLIGMRFAARRSVQLTVGLRRRPRLRPLPSRVDLPGHPERLPVLPADLLRLGPELTRPLR